MNDQGPAGPQAATAPPAAEPQNDVISRIKLALLEEYKREQRGYDPYDSSALRVRDVWSSQRKRA